MAEYIAEPRAVVLADSISPDGHRLTTMEVTMHRFVLAEFNTHRVFSRNSASSRAIPGRLQRERVLTGPAMPLEWPEKLAGMQGGDALDENTARRAGALWRKAALEAATTASQLDKLGVHKSVTNRLLEPFLMQTVLVTATDWDGFFKQRADAAAQPEIRVPAEMMMTAYHESEPTHIEHDGWHLPLTDIDDNDETAIKRHAVENDLDVLETYKQVSVARCARVSYLNHSGERAIEDDLKLYKRLETYGHWSPFEHVATPCTDPVLENNRLSDKPLVRLGHKGNFTGWDQYRHKVEQ